MLVLAKKPEEDFKAPLNTKKQAPVTATSTEGRTQTGSLTDRWQTAADKQADIETSGVSVSAPLRGW